MDIALTIHYLLPEAQYQGSVTSNTRESFEAIVWQDSRPKPSWEEIENGWIECSRYYSELQTKQKAQSLLSSSDWVDLVSTRSELENISEWDAYRKTLRSLRRNPVGNAEFPEVPKVIWKVVETVVEQPIEEVVTEEVINEQG